MSARRHYEVVIRHRGRRAVFHVFADRWATMRDVMAEAEIMFQERFGYWPDSWGSQANLVPED